MCGLTDWSGCAQKAATSALEAMAEAFADAVAWVVVESFTWWIDTNSAGLNTGVVDRIREVTWPLTLTVAAAGIIVLGIQMVRTGRADPLLSLGEGIARLVIWTVSGVMILHAFMKYAGAFSGWVLSEAKTRELGARLSGAYGDADVSLGAVIILSLIGFVAGVAQWLIGLFREAAVVILAGCLPLAAAGHLLSQGWERRIVGWCMALIWWQPCAALVYFAAYAMMQEARGGQDMLVGLTMLVIAVAALPALLRLFSWVTDQHGQARLLGGGGGAGRAAATGAGARMSLTSMTRLVSSGLPSPGRPAGAGAGPSGAAPGGGGSGPPRAAPNIRSADGGAPSSGQSAAAGAVPASRTGSSPGGAPAGAPPAGGALPAGTATAVAGTASPGGAAVPAAGTGATAGGAAGAGAASGAAAGAKGAALGGPVGAAAAVTAAGAGAAGRAMTEPPTGSAEGGSSPKSDSKKEDTAS